MKYLALLSFLIVVCVHCCAGQSPTAGAAKIKFDTLTYSNLVLNRKDGIWEKMISFRNAGSAPLIITRALTSGGPDMCERPKEPIMPGKRGALKYRLLTEGRGSYPSHVSKTVYIFSNASEQPTIITFSGTIVDDTVSRK